MCLPDNERYPVSLKTADLISRDNLHEHTPRQKRNNISFIIFSSFSARLCLWPRMKKYNIYYILTSKVALMWRFYGTSFCVTAQHAHRNSWTVTGLFQQPGYQVWLPAASLSYNFCCCCYYLPITLTLYSALVSKTIGWLPVQEHTMEQYSSDYLLQTLL